MKNSCFYFDKKYKCVSFIVQFKGLTIFRKDNCLFIMKMTFVWNIYCVLFSFVILSFDRINH